MTSVVHEPNALLICQTPLQMQANFEAEKQARQAEEQAESDEFLNRHLESVKELLEEKEGREFFVPRDSKEGAY